MAVASSTMSCVAAESHAMPFLPASDKCFQHAGPVGHVWYQFLDKFTRSRMRVGSPSFIAAKVVLDEGVFGPIHVLGFFAYMTLVEGGSWQVRLSCKDI